MDRIHYAGIGSRKTPPEILEKMKVIGYVLATEKFVLRSGAAEGADSAFEQGCDLANGEKEIFLPWKEFNGNSSFLYTPSPEAFELASKYHPNWNNLPNSVKSLHARNGHQILGKDLKTPSIFILCYSEGTGGTEQALRISDALQIPSINLYREPSLLMIFEKIRKIVESLA